LSPFDPPGSAPIVLTAEVLHQSVLRDALLVLGLDSSDVLAAPAFDPLQFQPLLLLSTLIAGACYAELRPEEFERDPRAVERLRLSVLGVGAPLGERLVAHGVGAVKPTLRAWFSSLTEAFPVSRWTAVSQLLTSSKVSRFNLMMNSATGGVEQFSPRTPEPARFLKAWPVPGRQWQLTDLGTDKLAPLTGTGVYTAVKKEEPLPGLPRIVLVGAEEEFLFGGTMDIGPNAQAYPAEEVVQVVAALPVVRHASVIVVQGEGFNDARTVLLVFVEGTRQTDGTLALPVGIPEVARCVAREMGQRFVPDRIDILPLRPRLVEGQVDHGWCKREYLRGTLTKKARSEMFILLSRLGYILASEQGVE
jgi:hypothetical protein